MDKQEQSIIKATLGKGRTVRTIIPTHIVKELMINRGDYLHWNIGHNEGGFSVSISKAAQAPGHAGPFESKITRPMDNAQTYRTSIPRAVMELMQWQEGRLYWQHDDNSVYILTQ